MTARLPLVVGSGNNTGELTDNLAIPKRLARNSTVALSLSSDTNDAAPTGIGAASTVLVTCTVAGSKLTGLLAGELGDEVTIRSEYNSDPFVLTARDPLSTTTNWFSLAHDVTLKAYQSITFRYQLVASGTTAWVPIDDRFGTAAAKDIGDFDAAGAAAAALVIAEAYADSGDAATLAAAEAYADALPHLSTLTLGAGIKGGVTIPVGNEDAGTIAARAATLGSDWALWVYPPVAAGTFSLAIKRAANGAYPPVSTISGTISITSGAEQTGNVTGWSSVAISARDALSCVVASNTAGVQWYRFVVQAS